MKRKHGDVEEEERETGEDLQLAEPTENYTPPDLSLIPPLVDETDDTHWLAEKGLRCVVMAREEVSRFLSTKARFGKQCIQHWENDSSAESYALAYSGRHEEQLITAAALSWARVSLPNETFDQVCRLLLFATATTVRKGGFGSLLISCIRDFFRHRMINEIYVVALNKPMVIEFWESSKVGARLVQDMPLEVAEQINPYNDTVLLRLDCGPDSCPIFNLLSFRSFISTEKLELVHLKGKELQKRQTYLRKNKRPVCEEVNERNYLRLPEGNVYQSLVYLLLHGKIESVYEILQKSSKEDLKPPSEEFPDLIRFALQRRDESETIELVKRLTRQFKLRIDEIDRYGQNVLFYAALNDHPRVISFLLHNYKLDQHLIDSLGQNLAFYAAKFDNEKILRFFLKHKGDPGLVDVYHETPLMHAAHQGNLQCVALLLDHDVDVNVESRCGLTAKAYARKEKHRKIVALLEKYGQQRGIKIQ